MHYLIFWKMCNATDHVQKDLVQENPTADKSDDTVL